MKIRLQHAAEKAKELRPMNIGIRNPSAPMFRKMLNDVMECVMDKENLKGGI
ncbi:MAG: hypothetical protein HY841_15735 [Bacteroidetes bacterium]|nr:hypothetical protein [Bacteroidota bacterium]